MANAVQIVITVDNGAALPPLDQLNAKLNAVGIQGQASLKKVGEAMNGIGAPALRWSNTVTQHATTSLDGVRLLSQEFGLRLPRAMEAMLSRMPAVTSAISGAVGALAGFAAVEIIARVGEGIYNAYEKYVSLNAEAEKFIENQKKAAQESFGTTRSIETTGMRLGNSEYDYAHKQRAARDLRTQSLYENPMDGVADFILSKELADQSVQAGTNVVRLTQQQIDQTHELVLARIDMNHAMDATLGKQGEIAAAQRKAHEIDAEKKSYDRKTDMNLGNPAPTNAGGDEERIKNATADAEAAAKNILLYRAERDARITMENEAIDAGLEGEKRWEAQRGQAIEAINRKFHDGELSRQAWVAETAAVALKFDNERMILTQQQIRASERAIEAAKAAGLTGAARIGAEQHTENVKIDDDPNMDGRAKTNLRVAAAMTANQKMKELEDNFADHVKALTDERVESSLGGFAKIDAATRKQMDDLKKLYDQDFANAQLTDAQKLQAETNYQAGRKAIDDAAAAQKQELAQRNRADDLQYDQQAARAEAKVREDGMLGWVAAYKNGMVEIQAQEAERIAKLQADAAKEGLIDGEIKRRKADIEREANAEIAQQNQQLQHQIAGNLQAAFTDPIAFIKSRMEQMFFEIVAAWIMRMQVFKSLFGTTMGGLQPGATGAGGAAQTGGGIVGQAIHAATGLAMPRSVPGGTVPSSASPIAGMPGNTGFSNGHPDISSIYQNIPAAAPSTGSGAGFGGSNPPVVGDGDDMIDQQNAASSSLSAAGQAAGVGMAGYAAEQSTVKAFDTGNALTGAMGDAAAGATIGSLAGPEGALIGAAIGAGVGASAGLLGWATGEAGNLGARAYYRQSVQPQLDADENTGGADFQTAISSANKTAADGLAYMRIHFGKSSADWVYSNYLEKDLHRVTAEIAAAAMGGRFAATNSAEQFHGGGDITGFGSFHTSPTEGFIHAMIGETVMKPQASREHRSMLRAMNAGASATDIAAAYLAGSPRGNSGGSTFHKHDYTISAIDAHSFSGFMKRGGAQVVRKHLNDYSGQYAGDGVNG